VKTTAVLTLVTALLTGAPAAWAQFPNAPAPKPTTTAPPAPSAAATTDEYKKVAARHLYAAYGPLVYKGKLPSLLYGVAVVETQLDASGQVTGVSMLRPPSGPGVAPWIQEMIRRASPFPAPTRLGATRFTEIWLVDRGAMFQLDTLTEGQR
jgi:hypothetical protein